MQNKSSGQLSISSNGSQSHNELIFSSIHSLIEYPLKTFYGELWPFNYK